MSRLTVIKFNLIYYSSQLFDQFMQQWLFTKCTPIWLECRHGYAYTNGDCSAVSKFNSKFRSMSKKSINQHYL